MTGLEPRATPTADALAFLSPQGEPPITDTYLPSYADLLHITAAPPFLTTTPEILNGGHTPDGKNRVPGITIFRKTIEAQEELHLAMASGDVATAAEREQTTIVLGLQAAPQDANKMRLRSLHQAGVRVMAIEYQAGARRFGSGWMDPEGPLTKDGRRLLEQMAELGFILDVSHSGERTAHEALEFVKDETLPLPVMASHGGIYESYDGDPNDFDNRRNLSKPTLDLVKELGGVVGIYTLTFGLSAEDNGPASFLEQVHEAVERYPDQVVIGSDAVYAQRDLKEWERHSQFMMRTIAAGTPMKPRHPDTPLAFNTPDRLMVIGRELVRGGLSQEQVAKVIGTTLINFFSHSLPA